MDIVESLPILFVRARNHYDVGFTIGRTFKEWIRSYLDKSSNVQKFRKFNSNSEGRTYVVEYLSTAKKSHPNITDEVRGMAEGADVEFEDLFLLQISTEIDFCHYEEVFKEKSQDDSTGKGCTDVLINRKLGRFIGHNDDWTDDVSRLAYLVHVTITDESNHLLEQFVSFSYPGFLSGFCFGMNKSLVITLDSLLPRHANRTGVPLAILLRSLLACSSIQECYSTMENKPTGCAYGMNINIANINKPEMCSMEVYPDHGNTVVKTRYIPSEEESSNDTCVFFHENFYKHIQAEESAHCAGSRRRDKRAHEFLDMRTFDDVKNVLGDTADDLEPIYRFPYGTHLAPDMTTVATAIFNINNKLLYVYRSNPKTASAPCVTIPFL